MEKCSVTPGLDPESSRICYSNTTGFRNDSNGGFYLDTLGATAPQVPGSRFYESRATNHRLTPWALDLGLWALFSQLGKKLSSRKAAAVGMTAPSSTGGLGPCT